MLKCAKTCGSGLYVRLSLYGATSDAACLSRKLVRHSPESTFASCRTYAAFSIFFCKRYYVPLRLFTAYAPRISYMPLRSAKIQHVLTQKHSFAVGVRKSMSTGQYVF